ncbi:MAG: amino acid deaminase [Micrococcales bacterium]|nr:amino acid deaminase [Micrococcales bacterium]
MTADGSFDGLTAKGLPLDGSWTREQIALSGWNVANGDTATPVATLNARMLDSNARAMQEWCLANGVALAPHAKTTLSPELIALQEHHGAWGMTAALPRQAAALWKQGVNTVLLANEVSDPSAIAWLAGHVASGPDRHLLLYADSVDGVRLLERALTGLDKDVTLDILVELGQPQGRTGARSVAEGQEVARAVLASRRLRLAGVAGYEGIIGSARDAGVLGRVDAFLEDVGTLAESLSGMFEIPEPVVTAGGSIFFDRVVSKLADRVQKLGALLVLRSGCYLIHDHGLYARGTPESAGVPGAPTFEAALAVWARVVSTPEPGRALLDAGRRDLSFDAGLPVALERFRGDERLDVSPNAVISALSDQHTFMDFPADVDIRVGDIVKLGISHPCTTLDRWRVLLLVDDANVVTGLVTTAF